jgi:flagellar protein FlaG
MKEISASLNEDMNIRSKSLKFSVDESTNRMLVKVLDKESGELIRQIPSEAILKVAHSLEALKGILFDDKY